MRSIAESDKYLTYIFAKLTTQEDFIRTVAGIILKNNVRDYYVKMSPEVRTYLKEEVVRCIGDQCTAIRRTAGSIITTIIDVSSLDECPGLLRLFTQLLDSPDVTLIDGTLSALYMICQDSAEKLEDDDHRSGRPLVTLLPKLFTFFTSPHDAFRHFALGCVNQFIVCMPRVLADNFDTYIKVALLYRLF